MPAAEVPEPEASECGQDVASQTLPVVAPRTEFDLADDGLQPALRVRLERDVAVGNLQALAAERAPAAGGAIVAPRGGPGRGVRWRKRV